MPIPPELPLPLEVLIGVCAAGAVVLVAGIVLLLRFRRRPRPLPTQPDLAIDLAKLDGAGPPGEGPGLEIYGVPVRLMVLVLAPVGRAEFPQDRPMSEILERILPGLSEVSAAHGTLLRQWPAQVSTRGFAHFFFAHVKLPGNRGRGTPWCSLAGKVEYGQGLLAGMVLRAAADNGLGQFILERESQWLEMLRVRRDA